MRYFAVFGLLMALSWFAPMVELVEGEVSERPRAEKAIVTSAIAPNPVEWQAVPAAIEAGRGTLVFTVAPSEITQPILPDIPEPIARIAPDQPPLYLTDITLVSWTEGPALASLQQVTAVMLNIRAAPSPNASVVASLEQGDWATIMGAGQRGWVPIRARVGGAEGWVFKRYLAPVEG